MGPHTRTSRGSSASRPPHWHAPADLAQRKIEAEFTLGLDEEWDDVPTAQLDAASYDEPTAGVEAPAAQPPSRPPVTPKPTPSVERTHSRAAPTAARKESPTVARERAPTDAAKPPADSLVQATQTPATPPAPRDITTGSLLCSRYVLGRMLGAGGSSLIFQAEDRRRIGAEDFGSRIAIKVLRPAMRNNSHALTRLRREFRQMQRLTHAGIAKVYELANDEDVWFMTMELIEGLTISQWLKSNASRSAGLAVIGACCEALHHAHETGVVHGDLKPSNVLVLANGGVKLVDFGSAAERDATMSIIDKERSFAATPPYASPQVLAGEIADPRDDVFSLACLSYAVLTNGQHPFERKSSAEAQQAQMRPAYARGLSARQFEAIVRGLAWDRDQRPASVREFLHALMSSDLRREPSREASTVDVASKPIAVAAGASARESMPARTASAEPPRERASPAEPEPPAVVDAADVARLKAAVTAAEAHADRVEQAPANDEPTMPKADPLARFKGYVAGPHALHEDHASEPDLPEGAEFDATPAAQPKRKWQWPWQRSALFGVLLVCAAAIIGTRVGSDVEPLQQAEARVLPHSPSSVPAETQPAATAATIPVTTTPPVAAEKKSPPVAVKAKPVALAPGEVSFTTRTLQVGANQTVAALTVKRLNSTRGRAKVAWTIEGGTARRGVHYQIEKPQLIEFLDGQSVRSLFISLSPDEDPESARHSKTFTVKLRPADGGLALGEIKQVYVTIVGDVADDHLAATADANGG